MEIKTKCRMMELCKKHDVVGMCDKHCYYWSKCEWEIILSHWPPRKNAQELKIDVYDQVMLNWPIFCDYIWANKDEFKVRRERK